MSPSPLPRFPSLLFLFLVGISSSNFLTHGVCCPCCNGRSYPSLPLLLAASPSQAIIPRAWLRRTYSFRLFFATLFFASSFSSLSFARLPFAFALRRIPSFSIRSCASPSSTSPVPIGPNSPSSHSHQFRSCTFLFFFFFFFFFFFLKKKKTSHCSNPGVCWRTRDSTYIRSCNRR